MSDDLVSVDVRQAILDLCAAYNWLTDTGDAHGVAALFTPDGVWDGPPGRYEGTAAIVDFNQRIHEVIRGSMHFNGNHQFEPDGDSIRHRCSSALHLAGVVHEDVDATVRTECGIDDLADVRGIGDVADVRDRTSVG